MRSTEKHNDNSQIPIVHNYSLTALLIIRNSRKCLSIKLHTLRERISE